MTARYYHERLEVWRAGPAQASPRDTRPPLLLVHGAGHGAWCWEPWLDVLPSRGWRAYALSLRHHPESYSLDRRQFLEQTYIDDYVSDVASVARHVGIPSIVIGHSMGGIVAQRFLARVTQGELPDVPSPVGLVLLASVVPGQLGPQRERPVPADPYLPESDKARHLYFRGRGPEIDAAVAHITEESPSVINEYATGRGIPVDPDDVRCPTLVVTAEHDNTTVPTDGRIASYYGADWLHLDIGHDLMLDHGWEAALERILAWLEVRVVRGVHAGIAG